MKKLLYLVHRLPYPPNKGDKISSNNMLNYFCERWRVHLGTFIDDPDDWQYADIVREKCESSCIVNLPVRKKVTGSLLGLLANESLSVSYYRDAKLQAWVRETVASECPDAVLVYSSAMGQYVRDVLPDHVPVVFNADDVDSEKWRAYGESKPMPVSWLYRREADKLLAFERAMAAATDVSVFISAEEAALFRSLAPESAAKVKSRMQGVDSAMFDPGRDYANPYEEGQKVLVFTGAMDYWPNIEAVTWFCDHVLAALRKAQPDLLFCIVGMKPADEVLRLGKLPGVRVTGAVPDVRPYIAHAHAACLPLQIARGIQNKALEAMAMCLPVIATRDALVGIEEYPGAMTYVANTPEAMISASLDLLSKPRQRNEAGRACVLEHYNWDTNLRSLERYLLDKGEAA